MAVATRLAVVVGLFLWFAPRAARAEAPVQVPFSTSSYGFDGPWTAVTVAFGTPPQELDLIPGAVWATNIFATDVCSHEAAYASVGAGCYTRRAGLYDKSTSTSAFFPGGGSSTPGWSALPTGGKQTHVFDTLIIGDTTLNNVSAFEAEWAYETYPDGRHVPVPIGQLSLGEQLPNQDINGYTGAMPPNQLFNDGVTASASFGMHLGSGAPLIPGGIPGSLWFGGYDRSRVAGPIASQPINVADATFGIDLQDISLVSFSTIQSNVSGILRMNNASIGDSLPVGMSPWNPYLNLPKSVCDAMAGSLPVTYNSDVEYYLWDGDVETDFITSKTYFEFKFSSAITMTINIPIALLYLELLQPLGPVDGNHFYFPCVPYDPGTYRLGRAFLQAAFFGANWIPSDDENPGGIWYLAQAPGPKVQQTPYVTTIDSDSTKKLSGYSSATWEESWSGFWSSKGGGPSSSTSPSQGSSSSSGGLSTGASAGIGVAVAVAVLALVGLAGLMIIRRRRRRRARKPLSDGEVYQSNGFMDEKKGRELSTEENPVEMDNAQSRLAEMPANERPQELDGSIHHSLKQ